MKVTTCLLALLCFSGMTSAQQSPSPASATYKRLTSLVGHWEGTSEWSGARTGRGAMNADYYLTGNGSALVENLVTNGSPVMTSVYHLDGKSLRVTHYCGANNQPRLIAQRMDPDKGEVDFTFVDATNLSSPDAPHVDRLQIRSLSDSHLQISFRFIAKGKESIELIDLTRKN